MTSKKRHAVVFRAAANILETNGWTQGHYFEGDERDALAPEEASRLGLACCVVGSVRVADCNLGAYDAASSMDVMGRAYRALLLSTWHTYDSLAQWNDAPERTKEEVVQFLNDAAEWVER